MLYPPAFGAVARLDEKVVSLVPIRGEVHR
jgi:hypothetical protein